MCGKKKLWGFLLLLSFIPLNKNSGLSPKYFRSKIDIEEIEINLDSTVYIHRRTSKYKIFGMIVSNLKGLNENN